MRIRTRLIVMITPVVVMLLVLLSVYTQIRARSEAWKTANVTATAIAEEYSSEVQMRMLLARGYAEATAASAQHFVEEGIVDRKFIFDYVGRVFESEPILLAMGLVFRDFDGKNAAFKNTAHGNSKGQLGAYSSRQGGRVSVTPLEFDGQDYIEGPYRSGKTYLTEPHIDPDTGMVVVSLSAPVRVGGKSVGVAFTDTGVSDLSAMLKSIRPYETGYSMVLSSSGMVVAHFNAQNAGKNITDIASTADIRELQNGLKMQKPFTAIYKSTVDNTESMAVFVPFTFLAGAAPWYFGVVLPVDKVMADANRQFVESTLFCLGGIILAAAIIFFIAGSIARPVVSLVGFAQKVAAGNYDEKADTKGFSQELLDLYAAMTGMIASLVAVMREADASKAQAEEGMRKAQIASEEAAKAQTQAEESRQTILRTAEQVDELVARLSTATEELSAQIEQSSVSTGEQREMVASSATAMEEMNGTVLEVARNAGVVADGSDRAKIAAEQGEDIVRKSVAAIGAVQKDTSALHQQMAQLGTQAESIGTIMTVISDIADQTNLLALNAAIEAARAGDAGRGFAVVADEVRKLAEKTMEATKQVGEAISGVQHGAQRSIQAVALTVTNLEQATELVQQSGESLQNIVREAVAVADQVHAIATAAEEQSATSEEISKSLMHINTSAQETATAMTHSAQAVSELSQQTAQLQDLMNGLRG